MIPLDLWNSEEMKKRRENAVAKALKEKPEVSFMEPIDGLTNEGGRRHKLYRAGKYIVEVYMDADEQCFIECSCQAGSPPISDETGLPTRDAVPCYHGAATLIHIAEEEKESDGKSQ